MSSSLHLERHSLDEDISVGRDDGNVLELDLVGLDDLSSSLENCFESKSSNGERQRRSLLSFVFTESSTVREELELLTLSVILDRSRGNELLHVLPLSDVRHGREEFVDSGGVSSEFGEFLCGKRTKIEFR